MSGPLIFKQMCLIMGEIGPIAKTRRNESQKYNFRGIDDVYLAAQALFAKHGVVCVPKVVSQRSEERTAKSGGGLIYRSLTIEFTFYAEDGTSVQAVMIGEGMDSGDKAANKAMSAAHKYALLEVFMIPTEELKDSENDHHEIEKKDRTDGGQVDEKTQGPEFNATNKVDMDWLKLSLLGFSDDFIKKCAISLHGKKRTEIAEIRRVLLANGPKT